MTFHSLSYNFNSWYSDFNVVCIHIKTISTKQYYQMVSGEVVPISRLQRWVLSLDNFSCTHCRPSFLFQHFQHITKEQCTQWPVCLHFSCNQSWERKWLLSNISGRMQSIYKLLGHVRLLKYNVYTAQLKFEYMNLS